MKEMANLRRRAGLTQAALTQRTGIHASQICRWERGELTLRSEQIARIQQVISSELISLVRSIDSEFAATAA